MNQNGKERPEIISYRGNNVDRLPGQPLIASSFPTNQQSSKLQPYTASRQRSPPGSAKSAISSFEIPSSSHPVLSSIEVPKSAYSERESSKKSFWRPQSGSGTNDLPSGARDVRSAARDLRSAARDLRSGARDLQSGSHDLQSGSHDIQSVSQGEPNHLQRGPA